LLDNPAAWLAPLRAGGKLTHTSGLLADKIPACWEGSESMARNPTRPRQSRRDSNNGHHCSNLAFSMFARPSFAEVEWRHDNGRLFPVGSSEMQVTPQA
jgi:hypothetical protein